MNELMYADEVYAIQGAIFEVYKILGSGFLEGVYQEAMELGMLINFCHYPGADIRRIVR